MCKLTKLLLRHLFVVTQQLEMFFPGTLKIGLFHAINHSVIQVPLHFQHAVDVLTNAENFLLIRQTRKNQAALQHSQR